MARISDKLIRDIWMSELGNAKAAKHFGVQVGFVKRVRYGGYPRVTKDLPHVDRTIQRLERATVKHLATNYSEARGIKKLGLQKAVPVLWCGELLVDTEIGFLSIDEALDKDDMELPNHETIWSERCKEIRSGWSESDHLSRWTDLCMVAAETPYCSPIFANGGVHDL